jgi:hypothetical protein
MESQIETRARLDAEMSERAYARLAASVSERNPVLSFGADVAEQADGAAIACLKYVGEEAGEVPENVASPVCVDSKGPLPIEFENGYVAFEDLPDDKRKLPGDGDEDDDDDEDFDDDDSEEGDEDDGDEESEEIVDESEL